MSIGTFREWLRESELNEAKEVYVIGDADGRVLSVKNNKFTFTSNNNLAYTFNSEKEDSKIFLRCSCILFSYRYLTF